jgi:hypothetical protein
MSALKNPVLDADVAVPVASTEAVDRKGQPLRVVPGTPSVSSVPSLRPPLDLDNLPILTEVLVETFVLLPRFAP